VPLIEIDDVLVTVPTGTGPDATILSGVTARWDEPRIALIGENGSGKSTLARLLNGLVLPSRGTVRVGGVSTSDNGRAVRRLVAFSFTDPTAQFAMPTAIEDVALSLRRTHRDKDERTAAALEILARYGLEDRAHQSVHALSGGQKQLLALASTLASAPRVLVADEPTTLLDLRNARRIADLLFSLPQQVVLVTHDLDLAARCDRGVVVADGRIVFDGDARAAVEHYRRSVTSP
jgi:biotin transport system ATP-binding protein